MFANHSIGYLWNWISRDAIWRAVAMWLLVINLVDATETNHQFKNQTNEKDLRRDLFEHQKWQVIRFSVVSNPRPSVVMSLPPPDTTLTPIDSMAPSNPNGFINSLSSNKLTSSDANSFASSMEEDEDALRSYIGVFHSMQGGVGSSNSVQLAGSYLSYMGRVRVALPDSQWGSICGEGWDARDATVVCRQLGFLLGRVIARPKQEFGRPITPIVMSQVNCVGHENSLNECEAAKWDGETPLFCPQKSMGAGVICGCSNDVPGNVRSRCFLFTNFPFDRLYCRYFCPPNHTLTGDHQRFCTRHQEWSGTQPKCVPDVIPNEIYPSCEIATTRRVQCGRHKSSEAEICSSLGCCYDAEVQSLQERCFFPADSPCSRQPCMNGGTCEGVREVNITYRCMCTNLYEGRHCEVNPALLSNVKLCVFLNYRSDSIFCSGTLISPKWVITAAHCLKLRGFVNGYNNNTRWSVISGQYKGRGKDSTSQISQIEYAIAHNFTRIDIPRNDIALLKLRTPITPDNYSSPICLPSSIREEPTPGSKCWIAGWGQTTLTSTERISRVLQQADIPVLSTSQCQSLNNTEDYSLISSNMICAGYENGGVDSCKGDSGGPLMCQRSDGSWYLAGIISWGYRCAEPRTPGIYTKVSHFIDWIYINMLKF